MKTYHLTITGVVQGVGFRPFIHQYFTSLHIPGQVYNGSDGVHIYILTLPNKIETIKKNIIAYKPDCAIISSIQVEECKPQVFKEFSIVASKSDTKSNLFLTPDYSICEYCKSEIKDPQNSRYKYPFTTCTNCGPRISIIKATTFDRENTTMVDFKMCSSCSKEYKNPKNKRFHSQTNSCPNCKIELQLVENNTLSENFSDLDHIVRQWENGKIVAIKSIGGYLLTCDANNSDTIKRLRLIKNRPTKPFALMYHDIYELAEDVEMAIGDKLELEEPSAPIVVLAVKSDRWTKICLDDIAPNLNSLGVMMPNTPLFELLLNSFNKPIIATSANISGSPIIFDDKIAIDKLESKVDTILLNNREIINPQDDSVVIYSSIKKYRTVLRRSRGLAPAFFTNLKLPKADVLALGGMLKSTFTILNNQKIHISNYIGNTDDFETQENYLRILSNYKTLLNSNNKIVLIDKHPNYFTSKLGQEITKDKAIDLRQVQHHIAHFYAVLGENNLLDYKEKILGVVWDGTGLGDDGNIWGGEFFTYFKGKTERVHHLNEFPFIVGDKMPKEPRISAMVISEGLVNNSIIKDKFTDTEWGVYKKLIKNSTLKCTSIGRLFDAVAAILLGIDKVSYEGEAAILLENSAYKYFRANNFTKYYSYLVDGQIIENFSLYLIEKIIIDIEKGFEKDFIAAKFHITLAHYINNIATSLKINTIAFSGGVFQNQWLIELILSFMNKKFDLVFHKELSPNDENISFGQLMYYLYSKEL